MHTRLMRSRTGVGKRKITRQQQCPYCRGRAYERTHRRDWLEKVLGWFDFHPFYCRNFECGARFIKQGRR